MEVRKLEESGKMNKWVENEGKVVKVEDDADERREQEENAESHDSDGDSQMTLVDDVAEGDIEIVKEIKGEDKSDVDGKKGPRSRRVVGRDGKIRFRCAMELCGFWQVDETLSNRYEELTKARIMALKYEGAI
jgi:hypothetical protein